MPQATIGRNLKKGVLYDLQTELHDQNGDAVTLPNGVNFTIQNSGASGLAMFDAAARPATVAGLFPLKLAAGQERTVQFARDMKVFVYAPFRKGTISLTGGL